MQKLVHETTGEIIKCRKCASELLREAGTSKKGYRTVHCKQCGHNFQPNARKNARQGRPMCVKRLAILLYLLGLKIRTVAEIVSTDVRAVHRWIEAYREKNDDGLNITLISDEIVELDKLLHSIETEETRVGYGRIIISIPISLTTGQAEGTTRVHLQGFPRKTDYLKEID